MYETISNSNTQRAYVRWFVRYEAEVPPGDRWEPLPFAAWLMRLRAAGLGAQSIHQARAAIVQAARESWLAGEISGERYLVLKEISAPKAERGQRPGRWLAPDELRAMLGALQHGETETIGMRNRVLALLLGVLGLRRSECAAASWQDVQQRRGQLVLKVHGKGAKVRWVTLPQLVAETLAAWGSLVGDLVGPILRRVYKSGKVGARGISADQIYRLVRAAGEAAGLAAAPHDLRRSVADLLEQQSGIEEVRKLLGHNSLAVTERYLEQRGAVGAVHLAEVLLTGRQTPLLMEEQAA